MGLSSNTITNFIFSNPMRRKTLVLHTRTNDEVSHHPFISPSLVLLPDYLNIKSVDKRQLPIVEHSTIRSHNDEKEDEEEGNCRCAVCLSKIEAWHNVRELRNCEHAFHVGCLDSWIDGGGGTCPVCRAPLISGHGDEEEEENVKDPWRSQRMIYLFGGDCLMEELQ